MIVGDRMLSTWRSTNDSQEQSAMPMQGTHMRQPLAWANAACEMGARASVVEADICFGSLTNDLKTGRNVLVHGVYGRHWRKSKQSWPGGICEAYDGRSGPCHRNSQLIGCCVTLTP